MRILFVQKTSGIGGQERQLLELVPAIMDRGAEVAACILGVGDYSRFAGPLRRLGVPTVVLRPGPRFNPLLTIRLLPLIRSFRPDLVHTHLIHGDVYGQPAAWLAGVPGVSSVHSTHRFYTREPYRSAARMAGHLARRVISISEHVHRFVLRHGLALADRIRVIHYGIDVARWDVSQESATDMRASMGYGSRDVIVGVASRLIPNKGHAFLLDAFARAAAQYPKLRIVVAGDGPLRAYLEDYAIRRLDPGAFRFLGFVSDVQEFMAACDLVAVPTMPQLSEGFGLAALEGMAAARPVVATRVGSLPEVVINDETGFLVAPGNKEDLATCLETLASNPDLRRSMGAAGRRRARDSFGLDKAAEELMGVYREVA
jgi:glycosyltransferase involved in cell wall biosynthesis